MYLGGHGLNACGTLESNYQTLEMALAVRSSFYVNTMVLPIETSK